MRVKDKKYTTIRISLIALMASMCAALGFAAIDMGNIKISFESLPVIVGSFMFGPLDGLLIGSIGTLVYQIVRYGFSITTILWMLPCMISGLIVGIISAKSKFSNSRKQIFIIIFIAELWMLISNTIVLLIDSKIFGYYSLAFMIGVLPFRILTFVIKGIIYCLIIPKILISFTKITGNGLDNIQNYK